MTFTRDIKTRSPFKDLFPIQENILNEIVEDMKKHGFDNSRPIVLWQGHRSIVLDGHTRLRAAELCNIFEVPTEVKDFSTEKEALEYTIRCQRNRRNLTDQELLQCISELDKRKSKGGDRKSQHIGKGSIATPVAIDRSSDETAKILGVGRGKVEKARAVLDNASAEVKEAVKSGNMTINKAYKKTMNPEKGSPESLSKAENEIKNIKKVINIIKKRLSQEQIRELIKLLQDEDVNQQKESV